MKELFLQFIRTFGTGLSLSFTADQIGDDLTDAQKLELGGACAKMQLLAKPDPNAALGALVSPMIIAAFKAANPGVTEPTDITPFIGTLSMVPTSELTSLRSKVTDLTALGTVGNKHIAELRKEAVRLYKINVGLDKADSAVVALMEGADYDALQGLIKLHLNGATSKFKGKCAKCDSTEFSFQSSLGQSEIDGNATVEVVEYEVTSDDLFKKLHKPFNSSAAAEGQK